MQAESFLKEEEKAISMTKNPAGETFEDFHDLHSQSIDDARISISLGHILQ